MSLREPSPENSAASAAFQSWWGSPGGWKRIAGALAVVALLTAVAFGLLFVVVIPGRHEVNGQIFGIGLAITAYLLGVRHAFDADHIAAIDNTTRKFVADGKRPVTAGLFFSLGHSTVVFVMALFVAGGATFVGALVSDDSTVHQTLGVIGTSVSGVFLIIIGLINLVALTSIYRIWKAAQAGAIDEQALEAALNSRGLFARLLRPAMKAIKRPGQMYPLGILFGLGLETASEVTLLTLSATTASSAGGASGTAPLVAALTLPLLFAAGMSAFDTFDGVLMSVAYSWSNRSPARRLFYNIATTAATVTVAGFIACVYLAGVLADDFGVTALAGFAGIADEFELLGYLIVGFFVVVWGGAALLWRFGGFEDRDRAESVDPPMATVTPPA